VTFGVLAFGDGPAAFRPVLPFLIGLTVSLAVAELRHRQRAVPLTPADLAVIGLGDTGRIPAGTSPTFVPYADGVSVLKADDDSAPHYCVDATRVIYLLPRWRADAARFHKPYPTDADREAAS
jgi:hypothetical protein